MPQNLRVPAAAVCKNYPGIGSERRVIVQDGLTTIGLNSEVGRGPEWVFRRLIIKSDPMQRIYAVNFCHKLLRMIQRYGLKLELSQTRPCPFAVCGLFTHCRY
jgi:hypothetical protein